jgi:DNA-binding transcriptional LysR family regulator
MIESRQLVQFLEIAKQNSFRAAAKELHLSQPALSRSIQRLEAFLGVKLFDRGSKKVNLTVFGEALLPRAATIVNSFHDANQLIDAMRGVKAGEFKVGFGPVYADLLAALSIGHYSKMYPRIKIHTLVGRFTELIEALSNGQIDIFVGDTSILAPRRKYWFVPLKERVAVYCCREKHPILQ